MKTIHYFLALAVLMTCACDEKELGPISKNLGKPGTVEILETIPVSGGVSITYKIPDSEDILLVKALYTLPDGRKLESSASYYENTLTLRGYSDEAEHEAQIYTINRAQVKSDPVTVKFTPLEASFRKVEKTMRILPGFGGAVFLWENPDKAPLTFEFFAQDSVGKLQPVQVINSSSIEMKNSLRGYEPVKRIFGVVIRDYWDNATDTLYSNPQHIVPIFEEKINKTNMRVMRLSNDVSFTNWTERDEYLIDDIRTNAGHSNYNTIPAPFTVDLGKTVKLSRVVVFNWPWQGSYYNWGSPRNFEIWGCFDTPSSSGNWEEWTKLMECVETKPSGIADPYVMSDEDRAVALAGFEYEFSIDTPPLRYVRFLITRSWENTSYAHIAELDFFGQYHE